MENYEYNLFRMGEQHILANGSLVNQRDAENVGDAYKKAIHEIGYHKGDEKL